MKKYLLFIFNVAFSCSIVSGSEETFIDQVNTLWQAENYNSILQLATAEAAKQPTQPEAFVVLFGYYLFIAANHEQAVISLNSLIASLEDSNPDGHQAVTIFKNEFLEVSSDQMQPPTPLELDGLHQMFPKDFPVKSLLLSISQPD